MKGKTVMNQEERYDALVHCRYVDEIIVNAPWTLEDDYLDRHRVRFLIYGIDFLLVLKSYHANV